MFYRSQLFVPGNRPDRFEKACRAGADLVCIDLEDAVGPGEKDEARATVLDWLGQTKHRNVSLRINGTDTDNGRKDIAALADTQLALPFIMIPKVGSQSELIALDKALPEDLGRFFPIIESAMGVLNAAEIFAHPRVSLGMYGAVDYAGEVGCDLEWETHLYARSHLVASAAAHDVLLFDTPYIHVRDSEGCEAETRRAKKIGIFARSAIHPAQIEAIHKAQAPSAEEIALARRIIEADAQSGGNVTLLNGKFIEAPVVKRAQGLLDRLGH